MQVLLPSVGYPTPHKLRHLMASYVSSERRLFAVLDGNGVSAVIGIEFSTAGRLRIRHLAVAESLRGRGIGRSLIAEMTRRYPLTELVAETDRNAVGFYRSCGFAVSSLGEKYPSVERFECVLEPQS